METGIYSISTALMEILFPDGEKEVSSGTHNENMQMTVRSNTMGRKPLIKLNVIGGL